MQNSFERNDMARPRRCLTGKARWRLLFGVAFVFLSGCATYQGKVQDARNLIATGQNDKAIKVLEPLAQKENRDQLVYVFDYAVAQQQAGLFKESARTFGQAEKIADVQDYTSLSKEAASILLSEEMVQYKGEDYEKVLINAVNAINYLMMNDLENALVEVRRLNNKLIRYKNEAKRDYEQNPFAYYISAVIWEADHKYDDAYIAYKKTYELLPTYSPLHEDLVRSAIKAQRPDEITKWQKAFPEVKPKPEWKNKTLGELVFIYQQGWAPRKQPRPDAPRFPYLVPVATQTQQAELEVAPLAGGPPFAQAKSQQIYRVDEIAIKTLNDAYAGLVAKRVASTAAKLVIADQVRQKNQLLGLATLFALAASDRADLRQWSTLPSSFQISRTYLKPGKYAISAVGLNAVGAQTGENMASKEIEIKPGQKTFTTWRSFK